MLNQLALLMLLLATVGAETTVVNGRELLIDDPADGASAKGVVLWLHAADGGVIADRQRFAASSLATQGIAVAYLEGSAQGGWSDRHDREAVLAAAQVLRNRSGLPPQAILLAGDGDGASFAQRLVLDRPYWFAGAVLVGGAQGGGWDRAEKHHPVFGVYANTRDPVVPVHNLRKVEQLLRKSGYPVEWRSEIVPEDVNEGYGDGLFELIHAVMIKAGLLASVDEGS